MSGSCWEKCLETRCGCRTCRPVLPSEYGALNRNLLTYHTEILNRGSRKGNTLGRKLVCKCLVHGIVYQVMLPVIPRRRVWGAESSFCNQESHVQEVEHHRIIRGEALLGGVVHNFTRRGKRRGVEGGYPMYIDTVKYLSSAP